MIEKKELKSGDLDCVVIQKEGATGTPDAVVILCHGYGAGGEDLVPIGGEFLAALQRENNDEIDVRFVFPAAPIQLDPNVDSRAWWMIDIEKIQQLIAVGEVREMRDTSPEELPSCREMIFGLLKDCCERFSVSMDQIVLGGFSQGAMLAMDVALRGEELPGGVLVWSGSLICETEWTAAAAKQSKLTVVQSHGRRDPILSFEGAELLHAMLKENGHAADFITFDGEHAIAGNALAGALGLIQYVLTRSR